MHDDTLASIDKRSHRLTGTVPPLAAIGVLVIACTTTPPAPVTLPGVGSGIASWGDNRSGQLGDGSTVSRRPAAGAITAPGQWNALAAGEAHVLALKTDGTVWAWGANNRGQLGIGTSTNTRTPFTTQVDRVVAVAAGGDHSLALKSDGTVWAWGYNASGQLGNGSSIDAPSPVRANAFTLVRAVAIAAGGRHGLAVDGNGDVWAWGENEFGQLGNGTIIDSSAPAKVPSLGNVVSVAAGLNHSLALKTDGTVWAWGDNRHLQLGVGSSSPTSTSPVRVPFGFPSTPQLYLTDVAQIAAGGDHNLALDRNGRLFGWGGDRFRESTADNGSGVVCSDGTECAFPSLLQGVTGSIASIAAGSNHGMVVTADGRVWSWGRNDQGQLGDNTVVDRSSIAALTGVKGAKAVAAGTSQSVMLATGSVSLDLASLDFGNQRVNTTSASLPVVLRNDGFAPVFVNSIVSSNAAVFAASPTCAPPFALASAATCIIRVTFRPVTPTNYVGTLFVNNDAPAGNLSLGLKGNGIP